MKEPQISLLTDWRIRPASLVTAGIAALLVAAGFGFADRRVAAAQPHDMSPVVNESSEATPSGRALVSSLQGQRRARPSVGSRCTECGVVSSIRRIDGGANVAVNGPGMDFGDTAARGKFKAIVQRRDTPAAVYEFTIRFRDGSTMRFNDSSPRTWRLGSRVVVVGRSESMQK